MLSRALHALVLAGVLGATLPASAPAQASRRRPPIATGAGRAIRVDSTYDTFTDMRRVQGPMAPMLSLDASIHVVPSFLCDANEPCVLTGFTFVGGVEFPRSRIRFTAEQAALLWARHQEKTPTEWDFLVATATDTLRRSWSMEDITYQYQSHDPENIYGMAYASDSAFLDAVRTASTLQVRRRSRRRGSGATGVVTMVPDTQAWLRTFQATHAALTTGRIRKTP